MTQEEEVTALREENARLTTIADARLKIMKGQGQVVDQLRAHVAALVRALQRMHDESSVLRRDGKRLNLGPMMEPSEAAVLEARRLLDAPDLAALVKEKP